MKLLNCFNMCTRPVTVRCPPNPYEYSQGIRADKFIQVPCGKCPECLSKRQKDISIRSYREALKYGSCYFVTLTYAPEHVPFSQTLLDIDMESGQTLVERVPELCTSDMLEDVRKEYRSAESGVFYKYHKICQFEGHEYQVVYTPTLNYTDVRLKIKNFRVKYKRQFGQKLDFSYICVGEYGHRKSHRPHYHCLFFGLSRFQVDYFTNLWSYGIAYTVSVSFCNSDGSDGLAKVASYIGKYAAKGSFNPSSVVNHLTIPCRVCSSRGLGLSALDSLKRYYYGFDIVGNYDIEKCDFDYDKSKFYDILFSRLKTYEFNGNQSSLPISLRRKIFSYRVLEGKTCWSRLYYEIMDYARMRYTDICDREFREFCSMHSDRSLAENCSQYDSIQKTSLLVREESTRQRLSSFYSKSKF